MFARLTGVSYVAVFNTRDQGQLIKPSMYQAIGSAIASIKTWPTGDQFPLYVTPANYEGLWWNGCSAGSESGWGLNIAHQGDVLFVTWFTYDANGNAWWLSMTANQSGETALTAARCTGPPALRSVPRLLIPLA